MKIERLNKEITFLDYKPYKVSVKYSEALMKGISFNANTKMEDVQLPSENTTAASEILVLGMTNLEEKELDIISEKEFIQILTKCHEIAFNNYEEKKN